MRKFTAIAAFGIAAALTLTGCSAANGTSTDTASDKPATSTVDSDGSGLRSAIQSALYDHVYLAAAAIHQALQDGGDLTAPRTAAAVQALDDNSVAVSKLIGSVYPDAEQPFLDSWRSHIPFFVNYTLAEVGNDQAGMDKAKSDLGAYAKSFGELINSVVPTLPADAVQGELEMHASTLLAAIDADIKGDPSYYGLLQEAAAHMTMTADALAGGIAADKGIN